MKNFYQDGMFYPLDCAVVSGAKLSYLLKDTACQLVTELLLSHMLLSCNLEHSGSVKSFMDHSVLPVVIELVELSNGVKTMSSLAHQLKSLFISIKAYISTPHVMLV